MGTYSQPELCCSGALLPSASALSEETTAAVLFVFRPRPLREPRLVFFLGLGASAPSSAASGDGGSPSSASGTWILAPAAGGASGAYSAKASPAGPIARPRLIAWTPPT